MNLSASRRVHVVAIVLLGFAVACEGEVEEHPTASITQPIVELTVHPKVQPKNGEPDWGRMESIIQQHRKGLANIENREGILAEEKLYSNFDEELIIRDFFQDREGGFYLDIGCARATFGSNTYYMEKHLGWTGIGVDALVDYAPGWREKRPRSRFFAYLVTDESGAQKSFFKSTGLGLSSTDREWASGKAFGARLETEEVQVESITLNDLLDREAVTKIDLLSMDIEGHEPKALAGFDIERFKPELVVIEKSISPVKNRIIRRYFERHGYQLIEKYVPFDPVNRYFERK